MFFGAAVDKGMGVWCSVEGHSLPGMFCEAGFYFCNLGVIGQEVIDEAESKLFNRGGELIFCQGVYGILHRIGRQYLCIVALCMYGIEVALQGYIYGDVAYFVSVRIADDL